MIADRVKAGRSKIRARLWRWTAEITCDKASNARKRRASSAGTKHRQTAETRLLRMHQDASSEVMFWRQLRHYSGPALCILADIHETYNPL